MSAEPYTDKEMQIIFKLVSEGHTVYEAADIAGYPVERLESTMDDIEVRIHILNCAINKRP